MTAQPPAEPDRLSRRLSVGLFLVVLGAHLACCLQGWNNLPVDGHEFRQTQTALSIRYLIQDGLRLDYETPLLGKPWAIPLEFPLYQGVVAIVARTTGLPLVQSGRLVGILAFYLTLPALYLLLGRVGVPRARRLLPLVLVLASPLYLFYTRAIMIESTVLCLGAWFLWGFWALLAGGRALPGLAALGCGALGAMVKLPALAGWLTAAAFLWLHAVWTGRAALGAERRALLRRTSVGLLVVAGVVAAGLLWSAHTDALKQLNPLADLLRSDAVARWGMGPLALRWSPEFWREMLRITTGSVLVPAGLLSGALLLLPGGRLRLTAGALAGCALVGPVVFANLYQIHDYYSYGTGVFLLGAAGLLMERGFGGPRWARAASAALLLATTALGFHSYLRIYHPMIPGNAYFEHPLGNALRAITAPTDIVVIYGQDWNPMTPYFAERRALMFPGSTADDKTKEDQALRNIADERVSALVVTGPRRQEPDFVQQTTARLGLSPDAVLEGGGSSVFVRASGRQAATESLRKLAFSAEYTIPEIRQAAAATLDLKSVSIASLPAVERALFHGMRPLPQTIRSQFGFGPTHLGDRPVFGAHPFMELVFVPPAGARRIQATYGILPNAYADPGNNSDGVDFSVLVRHPDGTSTRLAGKRLRPTARPEDRGTHVFDLTLSLAGDEQIVLCTGPGPAEDYSYDWAFWDSVTIE